MNKSAAEKDHKAGHPNGGQGSCVKCLFEHPLPPKNKAHKRIMGLVKVFTDDYKEKHIKGGEVK